MLANVIPLVEGLDVWKEGNGFYCTVCILLFCTLTTMNLFFFQDEGQTGSHKNHRKRPRHSSGGAIIESMHHHGKGVYSGTFSGESLLADMATFFCMGTIGTWAKIGLYLILQAL